MLQDIAFVFRKALLGNLQPAEIDVGNHDSGLLETDIQRRQVAQAPDKKQRAHQQHNGQRHLRNDQNAPEAKALASSRHSAAAGLQQGGRLRARGTHGRRQPKGDSGQHGECSRESQQAPVHSEIQEDLTLRRADEGDKQPAYRKRQKQPANGASDCEQKAFREQIANHSPTRGSKRSPDGYLAFASTGAGQHQVRQVRARDEQDQSGNSEQQPKRRLRILAQLRKSRAGGEGSELVFEIFFYSGGIVNGRNRLLQNRGRHGVHLRVGAGDSPSGFQATNGGEPPGMTERQAIVARAEYGLDANGHGHVKGITHGNAIETRRRDPDNFEDIAIER